MAGKVKPSMTRPPAVNHRPEPLATPYLEAEHAVGHHRDQDNTGGQGHLDHRHRREASAATCKAHEPAATSIPMANHLEENRARPERRG